MTLLKLFFAFCVELRIYDHIQVNQDSSTCYLFEHDLFDLDTIRIVTGPFLQNFTLNEISITFTL